MLILFSATIFTGALLLFLIQPLVGRMVLPLLGGSPAVWTTTMLFFQTVLLAAYGYAHFSLRRLDIRRQVLIHLLLLLVPLLSLPVAIRTGLTVPSVSNPIPGLLLLLTATVGLPFFVVSTTSPLLQRWFAASGHRSSSDPYFLYAASNCGSLLALVIYPVLIEPNWRLPVQSWWWAVCYGVFAGMVALCGLRVRQSVWHEPLAAKEDLAGTEPVTVGRRIRWVALATVPCSLMLSVTMYLTSEVAPVPLLWVIPLGIYLLTFILVFAQRQLISHRLMVRAMPVIVVTVLFTLVAGIIEPIAPLTVLHLAGLFVVAMACHGELAQDRPPVDHLTGYYLWMSVGGVLGGVFNALLAPVLFKTVLEYPLTLVLACVLVPVTARLKTGLRDRLMDLLPAIPLGLLALYLLRYIPATISISSQVANSALIFGVLCGICLLSMRNSRRFSLNLLMVVVVGLVVPERNVHILKKERSFFGVHRVEKDSLGKFNLLLHGNTIHGLQYLDPVRRLEPLGYYTRSGPLGQALAAVAMPLRQQVGVIGLGTGTLASYAQSGEQWTFFEIDPVVEKLARDTKYFSFLADSPAKVDVILGDARLALAHVDDGRFGLLIVDAFTADLVPLHLLTREALALYRSKVSADGVLIFNISNQHLWLEQVVAMLAQDAGWACLVRSDPLSSNERLEDGRFSSKWIILAKSQATLSKLVIDPRWQAPPSRLNSPVWTDDYTSIFSIFKW